MVLLVQRIEVPPGIFTAVWSKVGLFRIIFPGTPSTIGEGECLDGDKTKVSGAARWARELAQLLASYFSGAVVDFRSIPVDYAGYSPFCVQVLRFVREVPYGKVLTYGAVAAAIGRPGAARAVGQALARNRTPLVIPCHRVIGRGQRGGFSLGLAWKEALLNLEERSLRQRFR